jgi:hypothetical protein
MIFKNLVLKSLGTIRFQFLQKNSNKKFHACVPLRNEADSFSSMLQLTKNMLKQFKFHIQISFPAAGLFLQGLPENSC